MNQGWNESAHAHLRTHGHKSGGKRSRAYVAWVNMKGRCNNPHRSDASYYALRGISYDPAWESFENFYADMGDPPPEKSLDRVDNNLGYSKANCEWRTSTEQNLNKRNIKRYECNGKSLTLGQWEKETGIQRLTIYYRLKSGKTIAEALNNSTTGLIRAA